MKGYLLAQELEVIKFIARCCERRKRNSGFEAIFVLAGLLVAYLLRMRARNGRSRKYIPTIV